MHLSHFCLAVVALATRYDFSPGIEHRSGVSAVRPLSTLTTPYDSAGERFPLWGPVKGNSTAHVGFCGTSSLAAPAPDPSPGHANITADDASPA